MKRLIFLTLLFAGLVASAQSKSIELYYITHDRDETAIAKILDQVRRNVRYNPDRTVIFYLANGNNPYKLRVRPEDEIEYDRFREALKAQTLHNVHPEVDRLMLIDLFAEGRALPTRGFDAYDKVVFNFFITPGFVEMNYCDALIGRLFWDMELDKLPRAKLEINIYHSPAYRLDEDKLFGRKNLIKNFPILVDSF